MTSTDYQISDMQRQISDLLRRLTTVESHSHPKIYLSGASTPIQNFCCWLAIVLNVVAILMAIALIIIRT